MHNRASEDILEVQNREYHDRLSSKTTYLKSLAFDMEQEAKDHNRLLDSMDGDFDTTSGFLGGTLNRVNTMMASGRGNRKIMCYVILGMILTVIFLYFTIRKLTSGESSGSL